MFQRLLAAFRPRPSATQRPAAHDAIVAAGEHGRHTAMPRDEWRDKVLHPRLKQHWNTPDALYGTIMAALADGFAPELMTSSARLVEIDHLSERSHATHHLHFPQHLVLALQELSSVLIIPTPGLHLPSYNLSCLPLPF